MTALLVIIGSLFTVGCLVGFGYYWVDLKRDKERPPSDRDSEPVLDSYNTDVSQKPNFRSEIPDTN
jgi:hypothetical protein